MRSLVKYTMLPELWDIFQNIIAISPCTEAGFTLASADIYLRDCSYQLQLTHADFWSVMIYFLGRMNAEFTKKLKARRAADRGK